MKLFDHIFNGVAYKVVADDRMLALTLTDVRNSIVLWNKLNTKLGITLAVHEAMHAEFPALPEHVVEIAGRDIGEYLWKLGYRIPKGKA
jgi:hypothetical protein